MSSMSSVSSDFSSLFVQYPSKEIESLLDKWNSTQDTQLKFCFPKPNTDWNPYDFEKIQTYNPIYSKIADSSIIPHKILETAVLNSENHFHHLQSIVPITSFSPTAITTSTTNTDTSSTQPKPKPKHMFIKFSPLLDPLRYLTGKYGGSTSQHQEFKQLPSAHTLLTPLSPQQIKSTTPLQKAVHKLHDPNNASYVDSFFYYLSGHLQSHHSLVHGIEYYGSFLAIQKKFRMNVYDDITYLRRYSYFNHNIQNVYHVYDQTYLKYLDFEHTKNDGRSSRKHHKVRLEIPSISEQDASDIDVMGLLGIEDLSPTTPSQQNPNTHSQLSDEFPETVEMDETFFSSSPHTFAITPPPSTKKGDKSSITQWEEDNAADVVAVDDLSSGSEEDLHSRGDDHSSSGEDEEEENPPVDDEENETLYAYIEQFPVQMICMETCEGTLDQLFVQHILNPANYDTEGASMLFQVVATLIAYQKTFRFTHNDLHTNNIMWVSTPIEYLYYHIQGRTYRIPTYNRIYKIIDFGRAIYEFQGQRFCSDSFATPEGDASTQYNCEPYLIPNKPVIEPNPSFDLCRLACAMYDFLLESHSDTESQITIEEIEPTETEEESSSEITEGEDIDEELQEGEGEGSVWEDESSMEEIPETLFAKLIVKWCEDDKGKNMLYTKSGKERYPYFKLYQMIARTVHRHVPLNQIDQPLFAPFLLPDVPSIKSIKKKKSDVWIDLDALPDYSIKV